jgi:serine/threonine-protein kinase
MDARGDLYALGAVGYFMVTGTHVFPGRTPMEVCGHHLHTKPEPPSARLGRAIPPDLESLLLDCLEKDPLRRPQTAAKLQQRVRECRAYGAWDAERARLWWQDHGAKLRKDLTTLPTLSQVAPEPATMKKT